MKPKILNLVVALAMLACLSTLTPQLSAAPLGTAFTYQGQLNERGAPANGIYDLRFALYDDATGGAQWFQVVTNAGTLISNGLFTVKVDFGAGPFDGTARWLEIAVSTNGTGNFTPLSPRQLLAPSPYALFATNAGLAVNATTALGVAANAVTVAGIANSNVTSAKIAGGQVVKSLNQLKDDVVLGAGTNITMAVNGNMIIVSSPTWSLNGNPGTAPGANYLGTTDDQPLELRVHNTRALRLEPTAGAPNYIGGAANNMVSAGVTGGTIGGGEVNTIQPGADHAIIGGGYFNTIQTNATQATVSGGRGNAVLSYADSSTIGGGYGNRIETDADSAIIAGGAYNTIQAQASLSTIAGGRQNTIQSSASYAMIGGGWSNNASGPGAFVGGGGWDGSSISGNLAAAPASTVSGGHGNVIQTNADYAIIGGGYFNAIQPYDYAATISGGYGNEIARDATFASIGGFNTIQTNANDATIGGGYENTIAPNAWSATLGGGEGNTIQPNAYGATIPGGLYNSATNYAFAAGRRAKANHTGAFVWADSTDADFASARDNEFTIRAGGGVRIQSDRGIALNSANAPLITRGYDVFTSGAYTGLGRWGLFMEPFNLVVGIPNLGGRNLQVAKYETDGTRTALMTLDQAGNMTITGTYSPSSDRNAKENFAPVSPQAVLEKVISLPISRWNFKGDAATPHIGPMAQDFHAAFGLGMDDKHIATMDADGVALAAIQGLNQKLSDELKRRDAENAELMQTVVELKQLVGDLADKLNGGAR